MKVVVQNAMGLRAFLLDNKGVVVAEASGGNKFSAIGRLVAQNPEKFGLTEVYRKFQGPIKG